MSEVVITAVISGLCVAVPSITATITANKRNQELLTFQIQEINKEISELKNNAGVLGAASLAAQIIG